MMPILFGTSKMNEKTHLEIGGCDTTVLAEKYGTPLYVYDVACIRSQARGFKETFNQLELESKVTYASKAFTCIAMYQLIQEEGLCCDVVSGGELFTALKAGISASDIAFHGNNKTYAELKMAIDAKIGTIMIDNFHEIELLSSILEEQDQKQAVMLRLAPGVDAYTHKFILTGQEDSKFGFDIKSGQAEEALKKVLADPHFDLIGLHCHIGSQIFDTEGFKIATEKMMAVMMDWKTRYEFVAKSLNLGGGFGVKYTQEDDPLEPTAYVKEIATIVKATCHKENYPIPSIWIEPGRSIVAEAGTTLYTVGSKKEIPGIRTYVSVDGGMGENIRTALYDAKYEAFPADQSGDMKEEELVSITGKYCESGDMLIHDIKLPKLEAGDILAMTSTGAYGYSMASNYNRNPRPAVVFAENGESRLVIKRETYEDLTHLDLPLK